MENTRKVIAAFELGDMTAVYLMPDGGQPELALLPRSMYSADRAWQEERQLQGDCLVQAKLLGDDYPNAYAGGTTMRNSQSVQRMVFEGQERETGQDGAVCIRTFLRDERGYCYTHILRHNPGEYSADQCLRHVAKSDKPDNHSAPP